MAVSNVRSGVQIGQQIRLRVLFLDAAGSPMAPDAVPNLYLYSSAVDDATRQADIDAVTFTNATAGPLVPTALSTGYYEYLYTVPGGGPTGVWHDVWHALQQGGNVVGEQTFTVTDAVTLVQPTLPQNSMVIVELGNSIQNVGNTLSLSGETQFFHLHRLSPFYASPDLVRARVGPWISYVPDDTLALIIHWSSMEADFLQGAQATNANDLAFARTQFVVCDSALRALSYQGHGQTPASISASSGGKKALGDLSIQGASSSASDSAIEVDNYILADLRECRDEWARVINAGGQIVPGEGFGIAGAVRGKYDPFRKQSGRLWEDPRDFQYAQPSTNARGPNSRRGRPGFYRPGYNRRRSFNPAVDPYWSYWGS